MSGLLNIGKVIVLIAGLILVLVQQEQLSARDDINDPAVEQTESSESQEDTYILSLDLTAHSFQYQSLTLFYFLFKTIEPEDLAPILVEQPVKIAAFQYLEVLFEQIIAMNAP